MENAVDALEMAFAVLIFVIALSVAISAFSNNINTVDRIVEIKESSESFVTVLDENGNSVFLNYINYKKDGGITREVGVETIIPTIYRSVPEKLIIYFEKLNWDDLAGIQEYFVKENNLIKLNINTDIAVSKEKLDEIAKKIYEITKEKKVVEKLGEYYAEDSGGINTSVQDENKNENRIIIYSIK